MKLRRIWEQLVKHDEGHPIVSLWHQFRPPPWGGGNQFMLALKAELLRQGVSVRENNGYDDVSLHILHAKWFVFHPF